MFPKLRKHTALIALLVFIAALAVPSLVYAGGWAVITLDKLPENIVAGQPYPLGMMARQHGITPWEGVALIIEARQPESGQTVSFTAEPDQPPGHYQAELLFPQPGRWEWGIRSGLHPEQQPMPALEVGAAGESTAATSTESSAGVVGGPDVPTILMGVLAVLAFAAGMVMFVRSRTKRARIWSGIGLMIVFAGLAFAFFSSGQAQARQAQPAAQTPAAAVTGQQLFLAKGCVVCHTNERAIENSAEYGVAMGPNLTAYRNDPDFLHQLLKDPQSVQASSQMPNLELKLVEIEALIDFINESEEP